MLLRHAMMSFGMTSSLCFISQSHKYESVLLFKHLDTLKVLNQEAATYTFISVFYRTCATFFTRVNGFDQFLSWIQRKQVRTTQNCVNLNVCIIESVIKFLYLEYILQLPSIKSLIWIKSFYFFYFLKCLILIYTILQLLPVISLIWIKSFIYLLFL